MDHVFVETNWLVGCFAPAHHKVYAALELLNKSRRGEVRLYLPSISIGECRRPIREKFQVKGDADRLRKFLLWARQEHILETAQEETVRRTLDQMEGLVKRDIDVLDHSLEMLRAEPGVEVFAMGPETLERYTELSYLGLGLQPFDQAILACVLVKAMELRTHGIGRFAFCEADSDLQPWDKVGDSKEPLTSLYDHAAVWVYGDFLLENPEMPEDWPPSGETGTAVNAAS